MGSDGLAVYRVAEWMGVPDILGWGRQTKQA